MSTVGFLPSLTYWFAIWETGRVPLSVDERALMIISIVSHIVPFLFLCLWHECRMGNKATNWSIYTGYTVMAAIIIISSINLFCVIHYNIPGAVWCAPSLVTLPVVGGAAMIVGYFLGWAFKEQLPRDR
jgi:hypothetical protein